MDPQELAAKLHAGERRLLIALGEDAPQTPEELVAAGTFREHVQVMNAASWLRSKGLVKIRERVVRRYALADPAWADRTLPERRALAVLIDHGPLEVEALRRRADLSAEEIPVTLGWLKRKEWAEIQRRDGETEVTVTDAGRMASDLPGPDEQLLQRLAEGEIEEGEADPQVLAQLKQRKEVLKERKRVERRLELTPAGRKVLAVLGEGPEAAVQLTPEMLQTGEWRDQRFRGYDVNAYAPAATGGKKHPLTGYIERVRRIFLEMGFTEITGDFVGSAFWSFDALFQPQDHPARDMLDTFYVKGRQKSELPPRKVVTRVKAMHEHGGETTSTGWGYAWDVKEARRPLLRPHTTAQTIHYLADHPDPPQKAFIVGKVFRTDAPDDKHLPGEFHQIEGVVMEEGANLAMLIGTLREFYRKMGFDQVRFRPGYFPYTEPSVEPEAVVGDRVIELGGSGIFRPEVTAPFGITTPVLAWGLGLERLVMVLEGLEDIRTLIWNDLEWLRNARPVL